VSTVLTEKLTDAVLPEDAVVYPDSDGRLMSDNTKQFEWIVTLESGFAAWYRDDPNVFVAGDLLWYPVKGNPKIRIGPDVLVAVGRPKGHRGSYQQWKEGGVAPQLVMEVLSPGNTLAELANKFIFYQQYGVSEVYIYNPDNGDFLGYVRVGELLEPVPAASGWTSPLTGVRFDVDAIGDLVCTRPDGKRFESYEALTRRADALEARADAEKARADSEKVRADSEKVRADAEKARADSEKARAERLEARLKELEAGRGP
jgi:Uma2 family endonuclease